jgi:hypothetical protein
MSLQARYDETMSRADGLLREKLREEAELAQQDAEREREAADRARRYAERRREIQAAYSDSFSAFGTEVPAPVDDEPPSGYRRRLFGRLQRKLPSSHQLADIRSDDLRALTKSAFEIFERQLLDASRQEGLKPSHENLPETGELVQRVRTDEVTGERSVNWYGKESFIKQMSRGGRRVLRFIDPRTRSVLMGAPFSKAE